MILGQRIQRKDIDHQRKLDEADKVHEEKLVEQVKEFSELSAHFDTLKAYHLKLVQVHGESGQAVNTKQHQLESQKREIEKLQNNLAIAQAQVSGLLPSVVNFVERFTFCHY